MKRYLDDDNDKAEILGYVKLNLTDYIGKKQELVTLYMTPKEGVDAKVGLMKVDAILSVRSTTGQLSSNQAYEDSEDDG